MNVYASHIVSYLLAQSWQIAILAGLVGLVSFALRNRSAHLRYLLWLIVVAKCLVPPLLTVPVAVLVERPPAPPVGGFSLPEEPLVAEIPPLVGGSVTPSDSAPATPSTHELAALVWIAGVAVFLLWVGGRAVRYAAWLSAHRKPLPHGLQESIRELSAGLKFRKRPRIWLVEDIGQPFVWGLLRGSVYLPADFASVGGSDRQRSILAHEFSHIARFDAGVNLLQVLAQAVYWFHPLVWWANRKIRQEREKCCDEMAIVHLKTPPEHYTGAIVDTLAAERRSAHPIPSLAIVGSVKDIEERIKTMLKPGKTFRTRPSLVVAMVVLLMALVTTPTALVLTARGQAPPTASKADQPGPSFAKAVADSEKPEQPRYAARTFNSRMALTVWSRPTARWSQGWWPRGRTPSATTLEIPACGLWWVRTEDVVIDWDLLVREMRENRVPGLISHRVTDSDLGRFADLTELHFLDLLGSQITDAGLLYLKGLTGLEDLGLSRTKITDAGLEHLKDLTQLRELQLRRVAITDAGLENLKGLTGLELLDLGENPITDVGLEHLKPLAGLQRLDLTNTRITNGGLEHLRSMPRLKDLLLVRTQITDAGLVHLKGLTELQQLVLRNTKITDAGLEHLKGLTGLGILWLENTPITDAGLAHLKGLSGLQNLDLKGTQVTDAGLEHLKGLIGLRTLGLPSQITDAGLEGLKGLTGLQTLQLDGTQITDAGLEHLKGLTGLEDLRLGNTAITDAGLRHLKGLTELRRLDLTATQVTDAGVRQLHQTLPNLTIATGRGQPVTQGTDKSAGSPGETVAESKNREQPRYAARTFNSKAAFDVVVVETAAGFNPRRIGSTPSAEGLVIPACYIWWVQPSSPVKDWDLLAGEINENQIPGLKLDLDTNPDRRGMRPGPKVDPVTDADMQHVAGMTGLQWLDLSRTQVGDAGLAGLKGLKVLRSLRLEQTQVTDAGLQHLKSLTGLQEVWLLWAPKITDAGLGYLRDLTGLRELALIGTQITDAGLAQLKGLAGLQGLDLMETHVTDLGLEHLKNLRALEELDLDSTRITDAGLAHLQHLTGLRTLNLGRNNRITDAGLTHLQGLAALQSLNLQYTTVTDAGLIHLQGLPRLQWLCLFGTKMDGTGLAHLGDLARLDWLGLARTQVTDAGLANIEGLTGLHWLWLQETKVTDSGLEHLRGQSQLRFLDLTGTAITDAGLAHLNGLTGLQQLNLTRTRITDAGVQQLKQSLPKLNITR